MHTPYSYMLYCESGCKAEIWSFRWCKERREEEGGGHVKRVYVYSIYVYVRSTVHWYTVLTNYTHHMLCVRFRTMYTIALLLCSGDC